MTKLRRLDPQPADLTTHKGPFAHAAGYPARIALTDLVEKRGRSVMWSVFFEDNDESAFYTDKAGIAHGSTQEIFAAKEIREAIVEYHVYYKCGDLSGSYWDEGYAKQIAKDIGGTVRRFVEDTSYGWGV